MILYSSNAYDFKQYVETNQIADRIEQAFFDRFGYRPGLSERQAWNNSMQFMERIIRNSKVPNDCGVLIEFNIPSTSKRIDFMITGQDEDRRENFIVIELKQWEKAEATTRADIVSTFTGGRQQDVTHPSYQAWSYKQFLTDMNEAIQTGDFKGSACAYLHNYSRLKAAPLLLPQYQDMLQDAPIYFKEDHQDLQKFIYSQVAKGNGINTMMLIEKGRLRPSRKLMDHVAGLFAGNSDFILLDEQKVAYETILDHALRAARKTVIMVEGGPGTGKSVISINAFGKILQQGKNVKFVAPNAAFRQVMLDYLVKSRPRDRARIHNLFDGSSKFWDTPLNAFDVLVVDEAHRLKKKGAYMYQGDNQVEDMIRSAKVSVLFIDDGQKIRPDDLGSTLEIRNLAKKYQANLIELKLQAQFRCAGAEGFLNWVDAVLQIRQTGNFDGWDQESFEFAIMDSPQAVLEKIREKQYQNLKARMLAGYAWEWTDEARNPKGEVNDVTIPEHDFAMPWNQRTNSSLWAVMPEGINQIGCVHTSQGLEFDYVGLIIGNDLRYDPETRSVYADAKSYKDKMGMRGLTGNPEELTKLIRNIYKILFSRGMNGCFVYVCDLGLREYLKKRLDRVPALQAFEYPNTMNTEVRLRVADQDDTEQT